MTTKAITLDYTPRAWQRECHMQRKRFTVLMLHRRAGKTELALMQLIDAALKCQHQLGLFVYVAPFLKQAKVIAWARLKVRIEPLRNAGACEVNESELTVVFKHNGATIRILGADNPDAIRGVRLDGAVLDEVAQIKPEVWEAIVQPALSDRQGWALFIGTPNGINLFSELYYKAQSEPGWHAGLYTVYQTETIASEEIERLRRDMSETSFAREYLCDLTAAGDDQLISLSDVEAAARRQWGDRDLVGLPKVLGVDPARFGGDRTVIFRRHGLVASQPIILQGADNMEVAARVANEIEAWQPDATFIDAGAGAGVIDRLRQLRYEVTEVPFGGRAIAQQLYVNRRTEMWVEMAAWVKGGSIPNDPTLKQEMATPKFWFDAAGRKVLESKDDIKARLQGARSPDMADALALTFAHPVRVKSDLEAARSSVRPQQRDYDPYGRL